MFNNGNNFFKSRFIENIKKQYCSCLRIKSFVKWISRINSKMDRHKRTTNKRSNYIIREIKFRGLDLELGFFVYGSLINYEPIPEIQVMEMGENDYDYSYHEVKPETVGQFTGLKDKNGVEIYEGDILEDSFNGNRIKIKYLANSFVGQYISEQYYGGNLDNRNYFQWKVIGNIHENPELLNQ